MISKDLLKSKKAWLIPQSPNALFTFPSFFPGDSQLSGGRESVGATRACVILGMALLSPEPPFQLSCWASTCLLPRLPFPRDTTQCFRPPGPAAVSQASLPPSLADEPWSLGLPLYYCFPDSGWGFARWQRCDILLGPSGNHWMRDRMGSPQLEVTVFIGSLFHWSVCLCLHVLDSLFTHVHLFLTALRMERNLVEWPPGEWMTEWMTQWINEWMSRVHSPCFHPATSVLAEFIFGYIHHTDLWSSVCMSYHPLDYFFENTFEFYSSLSSHLQAQV